MSAGVVLQPLITMFIFTMIFGRFARLPSDGTPYPIFAYCALLPWSYFAGPLGRCSASVVGDAHLVSKVYFPRLILPLAGTISGWIDFSVFFVLLTGMMTWYEVALSWRVLAVPIFLVFAQMTALAVGLWLSALNVRYRDIGHTIPFVIQIWMSFSPVIYPVSMIPENTRLVYSLNPIAGVIEGFRWALLGNSGFDFSLLIVSSSLVIMLFLGGLVFFRNMEQKFTDGV